MGNRQPGSEQRWRKLKWERLRMLEGSKRVFGRARRGGSPVDAGAGAGYEELGPWGPGPRCGWRVI